MKKKKYKWMIPTIWRNGKKLRFINHRINKKGIIKRIKDGGRYKVNKILNPRKTLKGYLCVNVRLNGKQYIILLHRLLWETFVGRILKGYEINHNNKEGDKARNDLEDLECVTPKKNAEHAKENGLNWTKEINESKRNKMKGTKWPKNRKKKMSGENHPNYKNTGEKAFGSKLSNFQAKEIRNLYSVKRYTQLELAKLYEVSRGCISGIIHKHTYKDL